MTVWNLGIEKAWVAYMTGCSDGKFLTIERNLGDRLGICLKGTVLAEGVVLIGEPVIKADDDNDPMTSLYKGFEHEPPFRWHDKTARDLAPWVTVAAEDAEEAHELEVQGVGPICDDPIAWVLALRSLFIDEALDLSGSLNDTELIIPTEERAMEIQYVFRQFAEERPGQQRDYVLLQAFLLEYPEALKEKQGGEYVACIK